jgi:hypothetical protein
VIVDNSTNRNVSLGATCPGQEIEVGLTSAMVRFIYISNLVACYGLKFRPGRTAVAISIQASYEMCGSRGFPRCTKKGIPALPVGRYHTRVVTEGFPGGTVVPAPESVVVLAAKA